VKWNPKAKWNPFRHKPKSAGVKLPEFLPILEEMVRAWEAITDPDIDRSARNLKPAGEDDTKLGVIHSHEVRRTWALADQMRTRCFESRLYATSKADSEEESRFQLEQAARFDSMEDCLRELFWTQVREDIGVWLEQSIGLRSGWMTVKTRERSANPLMKIFGGELPPGFPGKE